MNIRISGREFKVKFQKVKNLGKYSDIAGRVVVDLQKIWIDKGNALGRQQEVLLHETIHAVDFLAGLHLSEETTTALANGLLAIMRDNPRFVEFLTRT